jgi:hypothetical protein
MQKEGNIQRKYAVRLNIPETLVVEEEVDELYGATDLSRECPNIVKKILDYLLPLNPIRGDWIYFESFLGLGNNGCFMYTGSSIVVLGCDYSSEMINEEFGVLTEFPLDYFSKVDLQTKLVWFNPSKFRVKDKIKMEGDEQSGCFMGKIMVEDKTYTLYYKNEENLTKKGIWSLTGENYLLSECCLRQSDHEPVGDSDKGDVMYWEH